MTALPSPPTPATTQQPRASWLELPADHPFGLQTLPYGVFSTEGTAPRVGVRIGDQVLDAGACAEQAGMESGRVWLAPSLNPFLAQGRPAWDSARAWLTEVLTNASLRDCVEPHLVPVEDVRLHLPIEVADYVDFYASEHHATNVGRIFRPDSEPLTPNWKQLPIGYHGRAGTVVVSGSDIVRPTGQRKAPSEPTPTFGPSIRLDIEAELGFVVGGSTAIGERVSVDDADDHLFGVVLLNDWSARDIQAWEYVPLGPFLGKSFATSISGWVVPLAALDAARLPIPTQDPQPLPYLLGAGDALRAGRALRGGAQRRGRGATGVPGHVLVPGADARPPDGQRRLGPSGRPVRVGDHLGHRARQPRQPPRAVVERYRADRAGRRRHPLVPRGRRHGRHPRLGAGSGRDPRRSR